MPNYLIEHQLLAQPIHHNCKPNSIISAHCPYTLSPHILYIHKVIIVWQPNNIHNSRCGRDKRQRGGVIVINVVHKLSWRWLYGLDRFVSKLDYAQENKRGFPVSTQHRGYWGCYFNRQHQSIWWVLLYMLWSSYVCRICQVCIR